MFSTVLSCMNFSHHHQNDSDQSLYTEFNVFYTSYCEPGYTFSDDLSRAIKFIYKKFMYCHDVHVYMLTTSTWDFFHNKVFLKSLKFLLCFLDNIVVFMVCLCFGNKWNSRFCIVNTGPYNLVRFSTGQLIFCLNFSIKLTVMSHLGLPD